MTGKSEGIDIDMNNEDFSVLLALLAFGVSIWLIVLFVRLCGRVKAIKGILMTAYGLDESKDYGGVTYRKMRS